MKKWLFLVLVVIVIAIPYIFIPDKLNVSSQIKSPANATGTFRSLSDRADWLRWWPGNFGKEDSSLTYNNLIFRRTGLFYNALELEISNSHESTNSRLSLLPLNSDTTMISWDCTVTTGFGYFSKIKKYFEAKELKRAMDSSLLHLRHFLSKSANIYKVDVKHEMSHDSTLLVTTFNSVDYPSTENIYKHIDELQNYAAVNHSRETNYPMLIIRKDENGFQNMVAIPIDKALPDQGKISLKRYVPWKILVTEIRGGDSTVARAGRGFDNFIQDNHFQVMAKPFQSLVTNRILEKDSSKWVTRLVCAIP